MSGYRKSKQSGQVLLITVMLLATVLTVVLSSSFKSTTDTQVTKLETESQKALSAAEAAIEAQLKNNSSDSIAFSDLGESYSNFSGGAATSTAISNEFTSPVLQKDEQYALYLRPYTPGSQSWGTTSVNENVTVCYKSTGGKKPAIEIALLKDNGVSKFFSQPSGTSILKVETGGSGIFLSVSEDPTSTYCSSVTSGSIGTDTKLMLVRILNTEGKVIFKRNSAFPLQGKTVTSEARSTSSGVSKSVTLFQSYPQIPSEFFVSSL